MKTTKITKRQGEYRVRLYDNGIYLPDATYFTDSRQDALDTAKAMTTDNKTSKTKVINLLTEEEQVFINSLSPVENLISAFISADYTLRVNLLSHPFRQSLRGKVVYTSKTASLGDWCVIL